MWRKEKDDLVWDGAEMGIAPSPTKGVANLQNVNISTETGEIMASFARFKQDQAQITNGTLTASVSDGAVLLDAPSTLKAGDWITVSSSDVPSVVSTANYLLVGGGGGGGGGKDAIAVKAAGGGGGGGVVEDSFTPSIGAYTVTVGAGGSGGAIEVSGENGQPSFITNNSIITPSLFRVLVVGGGGGGGGLNSANSGTGGGGGGEVNQTYLYPGSGTYSITVGGGGGGGTSAPTSGSSGSSSSAFGITSLGGAGGGKENTAGSNGATGGGGGSASGAGGTGSIGSNGGAASSGAAGGGGGGATGSGGNGTTSSTGGAGGAGLNSDISGTTVGYGGGGGGGCGTSGTGGAGTYGGGNGGSGGSNGGGATANRGGGGGGASNAGAAGRIGGDGSAGVVIIRFATGSIVVTDSTGASSSTSGGDTILTYTTSGTFAFTLNTGIVDFAFGGGGGESPSSDVGNGGSGGGASSDSDGVAGLGVVGQGSDGGTGFNGTSSQNSGGGGGGAGASGGNGAITGIGGNGGVGTSSSVSGTSITYGGGGGGGGAQSGGTGGSGGGAPGHAGGSPPFQPGQSGLGGGGGGNAGGGDNEGSDGGSGVVIISYATGSMTATGGAITFSGGNTIHTFTTSGTFTVSSIAAAGRYFVSYKNSSNKVKLSAIFDPYGLYPIVHGTSGTATFSTLAVVNQAISKATEKYNTDDSIEYRYYILDDNGYVWVFDSQVFDTTLAANGVGEAWMLPDPTDYSAEDFNSIGVLNGWLLVLNNSEIQGKPTVDLGRAFETLEDDGDTLNLMNPFPTHTNFAYVGHQGKMFYCDGDYVGELFPTTSLATSVANVQTYVQFTGTGTTGTITDLISGSTPLAISGSTVVRVPVVIFPSQTGTMPVGLTEGTVYYAQQSLTNPRNFTLYEASSGGSALPIATVGNETYINTFYPLGDQDNTATTHVPLFQWTPQRLNLPVFETAQCMVEIGNTVLVGGKTNTIYPWNQISALPTDLISLPEADVKVMINVNNMAYVFAGNKGNVYITNNSSASLVVKVPDYCAGVPGTLLSYIEPRFTWGDAVYVRGRVYFSILDQTSTKAGNCGGVWSFVPTQNFYYGQDTGIQLRLENQNSYGDYDGMATILIANEEQDAIGPQYWAAWMDSYSEATSTAFGIDYTDTIPVTTFVAETDLLVTGTFIEKETFSQIEYKMTSPLLTNESVQLYYRLNSTNAWTTCGTVIEETSDRISGYFKVPFQKTQWVQLRSITTTNGLSTSSFGRMSQLRLR